MKFAFVTTMDGYPWGGSEELWHRAAVRLKQEGHEVLASVIFWPKLSENVTGMKDMGIKLQVRHPYPRTLSRRIWNKASRHRLRCYSELRRFDPDLVVICQGHNSGGFDWAKLCRDAEIPYVMIIQCNSEAFWFGDLLDSALATYKQAKRVFCVSQGNLDLLRMQLGEMLLNAEVVWNPWNVSCETPSGWPDHANGWRLACVARIEVGAKGHDVLLKTLALPEWRARDVEVNLYGAGRDDLAVRRYAEMLQLTNVNFRGHVRNVRSIWEQNHLLVMPSRFEGLPLALVEAMWCARPALVTDVGGNAELCVDGVTGFVAPAATVASVSSTLGRAWELRDDWESMGKAGRSRVEELVPNDPIGVFCERLKTATGQSVALNEAIGDRKALSEERL
jgi:glycosyltransferase involved in cell wall biosynthesis